MAMMNQMVDETPVEEFIDAARHGSLVAYRRAIAKIINGKQAFKSLKICMTPSERDMFWANIHRWNCQLADIKKYVQLT